MIDNQQHYDGATTTSTVWSGGPLTPVGEHESEDPTENDPRRFRSGWGAKNELQFFVAPQKTTVRSGEQPRAYATVFAVYIIKVTAQSMLNIMIM